MPRGKPWQVLVAAVLSTRTKDEITLIAIKKLLAVARTPAQLIRLKQTDIANLIYPVGFYRTKARLLLKLARAILEKHHRKVPHTRQKLFELPGVGPKVANIVLAQGFGLPAIAVDTHVHRISNRLGLVRTIKPEQTEHRLRTIVPKNLWTELNPLLVALGQTICLPRNPRCNNCPVDHLCSKCGVRSASSEPGQLDKRACSF